VRSVCVCQLSFAIGDAARMVAGAGRDSKAVHWAIAMTLIQTAELNGVNPIAYLTDVLERVVSGRTKQNELHTLLPWNWTASTSTTITGHAA
jgi:transposase